MNNIVIHTIEPVYNQEAKVLILGTIPSPKSREYGFYYSHPQNRFWNVISEVLKQKVPATNYEKISFLNYNNIALWDVLKSCTIEGANDNTIKNPIVNDFTDIIKNTNIKMIFTTGKKAYYLYKKYCFVNTNIESLYLPSTSPANCRNYSYSDLVKEYSIILKYL